MDLSIANEKGEESLPLGAEVAKRYPDLALKLLDKYIEGHGGKYAALEEGELALMIKYLILQKDAKYSKELIRRYPSALSECFLLIEDNASYELKIIKAPSLIAALHPELVPMLKKELMPPRKMDMKILKRPNIDLESF